MLILQKNEQYKHLESCGASWNNMEVRFIISRKSNVLVSQDTRCSGSAFLVIVGKQILLAHHSTASAFGHHFSIKYLTFFCLWMWCGNSTTEHYQRYQLLLHIAH